ncbi:HET-domain-containing protein [Apiospora kogelbergensis]|uniref:HET-domain-containing protein n=1 Tax=Apiospora kogelbergensis TaxID=1337665 RepID=A0AAW0R4X5_9PEZI
MQTSLCPEDLFIHPLPKYRYHYSPIDLSRDAIRIVRLHQGSSSQIIRCELIQTFLSELDGVPYEALSYTWGGAPVSTGTAQILLDDQRIPVTPNLLDALNCLRLPDCDRLLWIDALCIDQSNNREKGHQVGQMRLVYQYAETVLIWLGPTTPEVAHLMEMMALLDERALQHVDYKKRPLDIWSKESSVLELESDYRFCNGLKDLLNRSWFQRAWVLQEVACARSATIVCGMHTVSSRTFAFVPGIYGRWHWYQQTGAKAILDLMPGPMRNESWYGEDRTLATLLIKFGHCQASVELDRVYALLGISSDASNPNRFPPDYKLHMYELLRRTISFLLFGEIHPSDATDQELIKYPWRRDYSKNFDLPRWDLPELVSILQRPGPLWTIVTSTTMLAYRMITESQPPYIDMTNDYRTRRFLLRLVALRGEVDAIKPAKEPREKKHDIPDAIFPSTFHSATSGHLSVQRRKVDAANTSYNGCTPKPVDLNNPATGLCFLKVDTARDPYMKRSQK